MAAFGLADALLVVAALAFAWSIGAHYTGACMGMAYASGAVSRREALVGMAILTAVGASVASGKVVGNIGLNLVGASELSAVSAAVIVAAAFALTSAYNYLKIPTSTNPNLRVLPDRRRARGGDPGALGERHGAGRDTG